MLSIDSQKAGDVRVIRVEGDVDEEGSTALRIALVNCLRENAHNVVVNLEGMRFISYMGVGVLVERLRQFRAYEGDMKLVGLNLYTQRLFRMAGVTTLFDTYANESDALQVYRQAA